METKALTITKHFACPLTESEKQDKHDELVRTINDLRRIEEHFAGIKEQHKANVKSRQVTINELSQELGNGYVMRPVACEQVADLDRNRMVTRRLDTGAVVDERALTGDEARELAKKRRA